MSSRQLPLTSRTYEKISTLPDELLAEVFLAVKESASERDEDIYLEDVGLEDDSDSEMGIKSESWMKVAHVCTHWREVALATPRLWSTISLSNPDRAEMMLGRCKDVPLTIECDFNLVPPAFDVTHFLVSASQQIQSLKLKLTSLEEMISISLTLSRLPILKSFVLKVRWRVFLGNALSTFRWPNAPALRRLELNVNGNFPHNIPPVFPSLVELLLNATIVPMSWFIKVLHGAPSLEVAVVSVTTREEFHPPTSIHLPRLRKLSLAMDDIAGVTLFNHMDIPVCTNILVSALAPVPHIPSRQLSILQGLILRYPSTDQSWSNFSVRLNCTARSLDLALEADIDLFVDDIIDNDDLLPQLRILFPMEASISPYYELCSSLPLDKIKTLDLSFHETPGTRVIPNILPLFSHLHALECDLYIPLEILTCLVYPAVDRDGNIPNPQLANLSLMTLEAESEFPALIRILRQRKNLGHPISKVTLMGPKKPPPRVMAELNQFTAVEFFDSDFTDFDLDD